MTERHDESEKARIETVIDELKKQLQEEDHNITPASPLNLQNDDEFSDLKEPRNLIESSRQDAIEESDLIIDAKKFTNLPIEE